MTIQRKLFCDQSIQLRPAQTLANGAKVYEAYVSRPGIFEYPIGNSVMRVLRPEEEVYDPAVLAKYAFLAVTCEHPVEWGEYVAVTPDNWVWYARGLTLEPGEQVPDDDRVKCLFTVQERWLIEDIQLGDRDQISLGYWCDYEIAPGTHPVYGDYDAVQRNIEPNHLAVVWSARLGGDLNIQVDSKGRPTWENRPAPTRAVLNALALDSADALRHRAPSLITTRTPKESPVMSEKTTPVQPPPAAPEIAQPVVTGDSDVLARIERRLDGLEGRLDVAEATPPAPVVTGDGDDAFLAALRERKELEPMAEELGVLAIDSLSNKDLKRHIVEAHLKRPLAVDASDAYVTAAIDQIQRARRDVAAATSTQQHQLAGDALSAGREAGARDEASERLSAAKATLREQCS